MSQRPNSYEGIVYPLGTILVLAPSFAAYKFFTEERPLTVGVYVYALSMEQTIAILPNTRLIRLPGWEKVPVNHKFSEMTGWLLIE